MSDHFNETLNEIRYNWSLEDLVDANLVEDMFMDLEIKAGKR